MNPKFIGIFGPDTEMDQSSHAKTHGAFRHLQAECSVTFMTQSPGEQACMSLQNGSSGGRELPW
jgi:hypothetical protein